MQKRFPKFRGAVACIALFFVPIFAGLPDASAQVRRGFEKVVPLTQSEAAEMWNAFKRAKIAGSYAMRFTLTHSPRRGENTEYDGEIFGTERNGKTLTRIRLKKAQDADFADFILSNSPESPKVWRKNAGGKFAEIPESEWLKPLLDGAVFSPFDLLMPYVNWTPKYAGAGRIGQAVHFFELETPKGFADTIDKVDVAITREFNSPAQTRVFAKGGAKTVSLGSVKKADGLWIVLELSARDEASRDKDKLRFRAAKFRADLPSSVFDPESAAVPQIGGMQKL